MRILKALSFLLMVAAIVSCSKSQQPIPSLAGNRTITSALGNDGRHWTGSFSLTQAGGDTKYTGLFVWHAADGSADGTDNITGDYNASTKVLTMTSVVISGNIEPVVYTMNLSNDNKSMAGIWTGSSDGSVEHPGRWTAEKQ